jgi:hypothetical protein
MNRRGLLGWLGLAPVAVATSAQALSSKELEIENPVPVMWDRLRVCTCGSHLHYRIRLPAINESDPTHEAFCAWCQQPWKNAEPTNEMRASVMDVWDYGPAFRRIT